MKRWMTMSLALTMVAALGCEKKKAPPVETAPGTATAPGTPAAEGAAAGSAVAAPAAADIKPRYADTSPIWALAPAEATFGIVVGDGAAARALDVFISARKKLEGKPFARQALEQIDAWRKDMPFDVLDPAAYRSKGIDLTKGMAAFGGADTSQPALLILPVGDLTEFRKTAEATTEKVGEREVDRMKEIVCTTVSGRYACAPTLEAIDAAMQPHASPLATAVKALPVEARGDIEGYVDIAKTPEVARELEELKQAGDFTTAGGALRVDMASMNLHLWANGTMSPFVGFVAAAPPAPELAGMTAGATTVVRAKVDPRLFLMQAPASLPVGEADLRTDLIDQLTGDFQIVTAGRGILSGAIILKVKDTARVKKLLGVVCAEAKKGGPIPVTVAVAKEDACAGEISLAMLKEAVGAELPPFKFNFVVEGSLFVLAFGDLEPSALKGSVADAAGSPEARDALLGTHTAILWSRGLGLDVAALPKDLAAKAMAERELADGLAMANWTGAQLYDVSVAVGATPTGVKLTAHATSFEADPADARTAYQAALDKRLAGDRAGYLAALADIEKKHAGTLAARHAALERVGTPVMGPVLGVVAAGAAGAYFFMKVAGEGLGQAVTAPGFGEPQPEPTRPPGTTDPALETPPEPPAGTAPAAPEPTRQAEPPPAAPTPAVEPTP
jgi:hypothetical protein